MKYLFYIATSFLLLLTPLHLQASGGFDINSCPTSLSSIDSSTTLTLFQKRICRTKLESCYSAFSKTLCDDTKNVFQLTLLDSDTEINPSATTSYNFNATTKPIAFNCFPKSYDKGFKRTPLSGDFTATGAYVEDQNGCFYQPTLTTPNSPILKENDHLKGPLIGSYNLTYQFMPPSGTLRSDNMTITVKDTTNPAVSIIGDNPIQVSNPTSYTDTVTISDNYLADIDKLTLNIKFKDSSDNQITSTIKTLPYSKSITKTSPKTLIAEHSKTFALPPGTKTITYQAIDKAGNISDMASRDIISGKSCLDILTQNPSSPTGEYIILIDGNTIPVYCDMTTDGGGWTLAVRLNTNDTTTHHFESNFWNVDNYGNLDDKNDYKNIFVNEDMNQIMLNFDYDDGALYKTFSNGSSSQSFMDNTKLTLSNSNPIWSESFSSGTEVDQFFGNELQFKTKGNCNYTWACDHSIIYYNHRVASSCNAGGSIGHMGDEGTNRWNWEVARGMPGASSCSGHNTYKLGIGSNYDKKSWGQTTLSPNFDKNGTMNIFTRNIPAITDIQTRCVDHNLLVRYNGAGKIEIAGSEPSGNVHTGRGDCGETPQGWYTAIDKDISGYSKVSITVTGSATGGGGGNYNNIINVTSPIAQTVVGSAYGAGGAQKPSITVKAMFYP